MLLSDLLRGLCTGRTVTTAGDETATRSLASSSFFLRSCSSAMRCASSSSCFCRASTRFRRASAGSSAAPVGTRFAIYPKMPVDFWSASAGVLFTCCSAETCPLPVQAEQVGQAHQPLVRFSSPSLVMLPHSWITPRPLQQSQTMVPSGANPDPLQPLQVPQSPHQFSCTGLCGSLTL